MLISLLQAEVSSNLWVASVVSFRLVLPSSCYRYRAQDPDLRIKQRSDYHFASTRQNKETSPRGLDIWAFRCIFFPEREARFGDQILCFPTLVQSFPCEEGTFPQHKSRAQPRLFLLDQVNCSAAAPSVYHGTEAVFEWL
ncbi:hypothetical protein M3J09_006703 [Ascochyta lentis]